MRRRLIAFVILFVCAAGLASAQVVQQQRGVDSRVDYPSLTEYGPWDDRNYTLTLEDLAFLAPNESELRDPIPAFFRVAMRKHWTDLPRSGPAQYPRSALQIFRQNFLGYMVDGKIYNKATRIGGKYVLDLSEGVDFQEANNRFLNGEVRVTNPEGAAESAIKIHPTDSNIVIAGSNGPGSGQVMHYSSDGGDTWNVSAALPQGGTCCDPTVDYSADGAFAYTATLGSCSFSGCAIWFYRSNDNGQTWNGLESTTPGDPRRELSNSGSDKEFVHVDKYATSPFKDNVYLTWHTSNVMQFAVSTDFGNTWNQQAFSSLSGDRGIGSDITTDENGHVYYFWPAFNSRTIRLAKSTDGGVSFQPTTIVDGTEASFTFPVPSMDTRDVFVYVAADADLNAGSPHFGNIYASWTDSTGPTSSTPSANHARIQVAVSDDDGASWTVTTPHSTADQLSVDRWHQWLAVGPDGTVHVVYYDTRNDPGRTSVDLYYTFSSDGALTWSNPTRLTSQISPNIGDTFEFGDYNGLDAVLGDVIAIFTDNRNESGGSADSVDVYAAGIAGTPAVCGNDTTESGEACDGTDLGGATCTTFGCSGGTLACLSDCSDYDTSGCNDCPVCDNDGTCEAGEDCNSCPGDCPSGSTSGAVCGNDVCEAGNGEDCLSCPQDCNGVQSGRPSNRYCCGDGAGTNPVPCSDSRCSSGGNTCTDVPVSGGSYCCGDNSCDPGEDCLVCALDCAVVETCDNGTDDDCDGAIDCVDSDCLGVIAEVCNDGTDNDCDGQADCDDSDCSSAPNCQGGGSCGDGTCDVGESCDGRSGTTSCPQDCPGQTNGNPRNRFCFVNGVCEGPGCP